MNINIAKKLSSILYVTDQKTGTLKRWKLYPDQERILEAYLANKRVEVVKCRQTGISTLTLYYAVLFAVANKSTTIAIVAHDYSTSTKLVRDFLQMVKQLGVSVKSSSQRQIVLSNGSTIDAITAGAKSGTAGRGRTYSLIIGSEVAYWPDSYNAMAAISATLTMDGQIILESTASAGDNVFKYIWVEDPDYTKIFTGFEAHPNYRANPERITDEQYLSLQNSYGFTNRESAAWWFLKSSQMGGDNTRTLREYPVKQEHAWVAATGRWIPLDPQVLQYSHHIKYSKLHVFASYDPTHKYVASIDTASGGGGDDSCIVVFDISTGTIAASWTDNNTPIDELIPIYTELHNMYKPAYVFVEINGIGHATVQLLNQLNYPVIKYTATASSRYSAMVKVRAAIVAGLASDEHLRDNCISTQVHSSLSGIDRFTGRKDYLSALGFIFINEDMWKPLLTAVEPTVYGPNDFNATTFLQNAIRNNRRRK